MLGLSIICYDRYAKQWTEVWTDNLMARMSHYKGGFVDGKFIMSGEEMAPDGSVSYSRATSFDMTETSHKWTMEISTDGENWVVIMKGDFTKM